MEPIKFNEANTVYGKGQENLYWFEAFQSDNYKPIYTEVSE